jgi:hypothetical protein
LGIVMLDHHHMRILMLRHNLRSRGHSITSFSG